MIGNTVFETISDLKGSRARDGAFVTVQGYYTPNDGGGGQFYYDSASSDTDDGGVTLTPTNGSGSGRWKRIVTGNVYNLKWWGAKGDQSSDTSPIFNTAMATMPDKSKIQIPAGTYQFNSRITFNKTLYVEGTGGGTYVTMGTKLVFAVDTGGFKLKRSDGALFCQLSNLHFKSSYTALNANSTGVWTDGLNICKNIACQGFGNDGFALDASLTGNADSGHYEDIWCIENLGNGFYTIGNDATANIFINIWTNANGKTNIYDNGFLGNTYIGGHSSFAGMLAGSQSWVTHNGTYYVAIGYPTVTGIEPGVTPSWQDVWQQFNAVEVPSIPQPWNNSTVYFCSRALAIVGDNAYSTTLGMYTEGGQGGSVVAGYGIVIGGDHGAGFAQRLPPYMYKSDGKFAFGTSLYVDDVDDAHFYTEVSKILGLTIGHTTGGIIQLKTFADHLMRFFSNNTAGDTGFYITATGFPGTSAGRSGVLPPAHPIFDYLGFWMSDTANVTNMRNFKCSSASPALDITPQQAAQGDFSFNIGADNTIHGWKCTVSGTPGTWQVCYLKTTP